MLAKGRDTHKYFSKNYMLYEKNQVFLITCCENVSDFQELICKKGLEYSLNI